MVLTVRTVEFKGTEFFREGLRDIIWHELGRISSIWIAREKGGGILSKEIFFLSFFLFY